MDVIKLRIWRWRDLSELSRRAQFNHEILIRQAGGQRQRRRQDDDGGRDGSDIL